VILAMATLDIDPAQRDVFIEAARAAAAIFRGQEGCEHFAFSADLDDAGRFYIAERWSSEETLKAHDAQPASADFKAAMTPIVRGADFKKWNLDNPEWTAL
jgi:quinol monooxygenase YgiN